MPKRQLFLTETSQVPGTSAGDNYALEPIVATVLDKTSQTPAIQGKLLVMQFLNTNQSGAAYTNTTTLSGLYPSGTYGIVSVPASVQGGQAEIVQQGGPVNALVTTLTSQIVPGNLLQADAFGNLCSVGGTIAAGSVLAIALGTLTTAGAQGGFTTAPVLIPVVVCAA